MADTPELSARTQRAELARAELLRMAERLHTAADKAAKPVDLPPIADAHREIIALYLTI